MKKYITLAALLTAGAAFANAETVQDFTFGDSSSVTLGTEIDLTKDWTIEFSISANPYADVAGTAIIYCSALSLTSNAQGASFDVWAAGENANFSDSNWQWSGFMGQETDFTFEYNADTMSLKAIVFVGGSESPTEAVIDNVVYTAGSSLSSMVTSISAEGWTKPIGTITGTAIPEPSAFGLLAGLGALALVGTRRRRK